MDFNGHASSCTKCYAPVNRYCAEGKRLRIDEDAEFFAGDLVKLSSRSDREAYMAKYCRKYFDFPALKLAITEKYQAFKQQERANEPDRQL